MPVRLFFFVLVVVLLTFLGSEGVRIYETFVFVTVGDEKKIKNVLDKFTDHFEPSRSECFERFKFRKWYQAPGESCEKWLLELRSLIKTCNYGTITASTMRDQLVIGVADAGTQEKFLFEKNLDLDKAVEILRACELAQSRREHMTSSEPCCSALSSTFRRPEKPRDNNSSAPPAGQPECTGCGRRNPDGHCWAADKECHYCCQVGHLARYCEEKKKKKGRQVHSIREEANSTQRNQQCQEEETVHLISSGPSADNFYIHALSSGSESSEWWETFKVEGFDVSIKLDSVPHATCCLRPFSPVSLNKGAICAQDHASRPMEHQIIG